MNLSRRQRGCIARMLVAAALAVLPAGCSEETEETKEEQSESTKLRPNSVPSDADGKETMDVDSLSSSAMGWTMVEQPAQEGQAK